jgi:hypothetical protein
MNCVFQRDWHLQVERIDKNLTSSCHYLDSYAEKKAVLEININDYCIQRAQLVKLGCPGGFTENTIELNEIRGVSAYASSGPILRTILKPLISEQDRELINQCIIGAFQGETFIFQERGFASAEQYSQAGDEFLLGTCRYYSNLERTTHSWFEYIGLPERKKYLFNRFKNQQLMATPEDYWLIGSLNDTFHQVNTVLQLDKTDHRVKSAWGGLLKAPDKVFLQALDEYLPKAAGVEFIIVIFGHDSHCEDYGDFYLTVNGYREFTRRMKSFSDTRPLLYVLSGGSQPQIAAQAIPAVIESLL